MESFPECPICSEYLTTSFKTPCCSQDLHLECFEKCVNSNSKCPFCRFSIPRTTERVVINIQYDNMQIQNNIINPLLIQERRQIHFCPFCSCLICCLFIVAFISGIIGFPLGYNTPNYHNYHNHHNNNFTKYNNTLNWD